MLTFKKLLQEELDTRNAHVPTQLLTRKKTTDSDDEKDESDDAELDEFSSAAGVAGWTGPLGVSRNKEA